MEILDRLWSLLSDKHGGDSRTRERNRGDHVEKQLIESHRQRAEEVSRRRRQIAEEIGQHEEAIADLETDTEGQTEIIEELVAEANALEGESYSVILETQ